MQKLFVVGLALLLSACATTPVPSADARPAAAVYDLALTRPQPGSAAVTVVRDSGLMGAACNDVLYIDGQKIAALGTGEKITVYLSPGHHVLGTTAAGICAGGTASAETTIRAGESRTYRIGSGQGGTLSMQPSAF